MLSATTSFYAMTYLDEINHGHESKSLLEFHSDLLLGTEFDHGHDLEWSILALVLFLLGIFMGTLLIAIVSASHDKAMLSMDEVSNSILND
jgi:hypothetical protein